MFSSRLDWSLPPNRLALALEAKRRTKAAVLDLTESNPTRAGFSYPSELLGALAGPCALRYDPRPAGSARAREAVAAYYAARGQAVGPERILLTASTSEAYAYLFKLLANPGDEVLAPRPSYPLFDFLAGLESVRLAPYRLVYDHGWSIDLDSIARVLTGRTRALILVNPNNPTGSFVKRRELERIVALCVERDVAIVSDEVFADYAFGPDPERAATLAGIEGVLAFCLGGLSKLAGLPQMKAAWIVAAGPPSARALERLELIADTYLSVGAPVQLALPRFLEAGAAIQAQIVQRLRANLGYLGTAVRAAPACGLLDVEGGWYAILRVPRTRTEEEWCLELLEKHNVLVQPGFFYDFETEAFLVLSLLTRPEIFREGLGRLLACAGA